MKNNNRSRQLTIHDSLTEVFDEEARRAVEKSIDDVRGVMFEKDIGGKSMFQALIDSTFERQKEVLEKNRGRIAPVDLSDGCKSEMLSGLENVYKSGSFTKALYEFDLLFEEVFIMKEKSKLIKPRFIHRENREIVEYFEKKNNPKSPSSVLNYDSYSNVNSISKRVSRKLLYTPIGVFAGAIGTGGELKKNALNKIEKIGDILYLNGFPSWRNILRYRLDQKLFEEQKGKLRKQYFDDTKNLIQIDDMEDNPRATFKIDGYTETDPSRILSDIKKYENRIKFFQDSLKETDYQTSSVTDKIIEQLQRKVLAIPSLKNEVLIKKNPKEVFEYVNNLYGNPRAREIIDSAEEAYENGIIERTNGKMRTMNETKPGYKMKSFDALVFDLIRFYTSSNGHRDKLDSMIDNDKGEIRRLKEYVIDNRILDGNRTSTVPVKRETRTYRRDPSQKLITVYAKQI